MASTNLTPTLVEELGRGFDADAFNTVRQNALAESDAGKLVLNQKVAMAIDRNFSTRLDDWGPTDQKGSGRCWLFAATNLLRVGVMRKLNLKSFEFSQNWLLFWDKLEKANYFLEAILDTADRDLDDRTVVTVLGNCVNDGGQWNMFVNIALKHGLVPKAAMPETLSSSATGEHERRARGSPARGREAPARARRRLDARRGHREGPARHHEGRLRHPAPPPRQPARAVRLAVDRRQEEVPPREGHDAEDVHEEVRDAPPRRVRLPRARPAEDQPRRPDLHRRVPRQRGGRRHR